MIFMLSDKAKQAKNEYMRVYMKEWSKRNPEKVRSYNKRYWENRAKRKEENQS